METQQRPRVTPLMAWKVVWICICMAVGFGAAFYAGYNRMPYVLAPCIFLEMSCSTLLVLISHYQKGTLFQGHNPNSMKAALWIGCIVLCLSILGCLFFGITALKKMKEIEYEKYGLYAALVPCFLAVFWSGVLIYDSRYYWRMWQRVLGNAMAGAQIVFRP